MKSQPIKHWRVREGDLTRLHNNNWPYHPNVNTDLTQIDETTGIRWATGEGKIYNEKQRGVIHQFNSHGLHGAELHHSPDIVTLGCSMTNGIGMPHNFSWPHVVGHVTGQTVNNISEHGQSCAQQFISFLGHNGTYGKPKKVMMLVPPIDRMYFSMPGYGSTTLHYNEKLSHYTDPKTRQPAILESLDGTKFAIPLNIAIDQSLMFIDCLIIYCQNENIELTLNSWSAPTLESLMMLYPDQQVIGHEFGWVQGKGKAFEGSVGCKCALRPQNEFQEDFWHSAKDHHYERPHPGFHQQIHFAEIFLQSEISNNDIVNIMPFWVGTDMEKYCRT